MPWPHSHPLWFASTPSKLWTSRPPAPDFREDRVQAGPRGQLHSRDPTHITGSCVHIDINATGGVGFTANGHLALIPS